MDDCIWKTRESASVSAPNHVIDQIRDVLMSGAMKPGDRLPSETELASLCGVSRGSVRQAMKALETMGILSICPGNGTFINTSITGKRLNPLIFALLISGPSVRELADARLALEEDILERLIQNRELADAILPDLRENLKRHERMLREGAGYDKLLENDLQFHRIISNGCGNVLLQTIYDYLMDSFEHLLGYTTQRQLNRDVTVAAHTSVIQALESGSYALAKEAAKQSVQYWYDLMLEDPAVGEADPVSFSSNYSTSASSL